MSIYGRPYTITLSTGIVFATRASSTLEALDLRAQDVGYPNHEAACAATGHDPEDWTTSRSDFDAGKFGILVEYA